MRPNRSFDTNAQRQAFASFRPLSAIGVMANYGLVPAVPK
jgi:hypothetical protein